LLGPDEVYISTTAFKEASQPVIIEGRVMVTRSPSTEPRDIRILKAVNVPALVPLVDVVVFSQKSRSPDF